MQWMIDNWAQLGVVYAALTTALVAVLRLIPDSASAKVLIELIKLTSPSVEVESIEED